ncbi:cystine transport system permease protein [Thalassobacillus devorans]|uniref:amino acid ABC transporter permease n=1 Tax=Thalassobacillus devorans TaxID=279813 RepID=UPI0007862B69|nr:amino acid ABC transporter permease [Thalassobacillus devorans]NIK27328.1 cystine transport system permease protein [Thalassobacillus devorans]
MFPLSNLIIASAINMERYLDIFQSSFFPLLEGALARTIPLTLIAFSIGLMLAVITALFRLSGIKALEIIARIYISIIRGTPLLVQLYIIFFGLGSVGIEIDPFPAAIIGFSLNTGAYASEIIRAAIQSIPKGQWEASYSISMSYGQALRRIIIPQATRVSIPPLSNSFISLVKDTSLASTIMVTEMFRKSQEIVATTYEPLLLYTEAALLYWTICFLLSLGQDAIEKHLNRYVQT